MEKPTERSGAERAAAESVVCGFHAVQSLLARAPDDVIEVLLDPRRRDQRAARLRRDLARGGFAFRAAEPDELTRRADGVRHQGVVARVRRRGHSARDESALHQLLDGLTRPALLLVLDQVQDPHNLGACLRAADGAGADAVILPKDRACPINATAARVAAGAVERLAVFYVANLARALGALRARGVWVIGGDHAAPRALYEVDLRVDSAIVVGAEGRGLRRLTRAQCDGLARIPMAGAGASLNVAVAAGVFLFEAVRQRAQ